MKFAIIFLSLVLLFGVTISAHMMRFEYVGQAGVEIRIDRWQGCVQTWSSNDNKYVISPNITNASCEFRSTSPQAPDSFSS